MLFRSMVKRAISLASLFYRCSRSKLVLCAGRSLATPALPRLRTEVNKTNKEIKLKTLKVELIPRFRRESISFSLGIITALTNVSAACLIRWLNLCHVSFILPYKINRLLFRTLKKSSIVIVVFFPGCLGCLGWKFLFRLCCAKLRRNYFVTTLDC